MVNLTFFTLKVNLNVRWLACTGSTNIRFKVTSEAMAGPSGVKSCITFKDKAP